MQDDLKERCYLLLKRGLYYAPDNKGYTGIKDKAGRYLERDASPRNGVTAIHEDEAPDFSPACCDDLKVAHLQDRIAALEAKLAEKDALLRECGEALAEYACHGGPDLPCIRSKDQCRTECGKIAGDTLAKIKDATDAD